MCFCGKEKANNSRISFSLQHYILQVSQQVPTCYAKKAREPCSGEGKHAKWKANSFHGNLTFIMDMGEN